MGDYQNEKLNNPKKVQVDLLYQKGKYYLIPVVETPVSPETPANEVLGIDLGIVNLAVDSKREFYSGEEVDTKREKIDILKKALQKRQTKSAKRHLQKLSGKESRFRKDVNHCMSKRIVAKCKRHSMSLGLEDLKGSDNE